MSKYPYNDKPYVSGKTLGEIFVDIALKKIKEKKQSKSNDVSNEDASDLTKDEVNEDKK